MHARLFALAVLIGGNALAVPVTVRDPGGKPRRRATAAPKDQQGDQQRRGHAHAPG